MNLVLIGMRGAGKSNISRRLSVLTKRTVLSTDTLISYENGGRTIPEILEAFQGEWRQFREWEYKVVRKVAAMDGMIVDCGGGVVVDLDEAGREIFSHRKIDALKRTGRLIWLKGDIPRLAARVSADQRRPTLNQAMTEEEIMRRRQPFYEQAADFIIDIEGVKRKNLVLQILKQTGLS